MNHELITMNYLRAVAADKNLKIYDIPGMYALGMSAYSFYPLTTENTIPLPYGSELFVLPKRIPLTFDPYTQEISSAGTLLPVAAFVSPGYTQTFTAAYQPMPHAPQLPLFSYTAVGFLHGKFRVAAVRIDQSRRQDLRLMNQRLMQKNILRFKKLFRSNRLV